MSEYISPWAIKKPAAPAFTEMELALMEGGNSLEVEPKRCNMPFIKELQEMRATEFLPELFDPKLAMPLQWEVSPGTVYAYGQVRTKHGDVSIDITFAEMDKGVWNIEFMVGGSFELTGGGGSSQVFATVIAGVKKFLTKVKNVNAITFTAEEKSRAKAYDTIAKRVARDIDWHVVPFEDMQVDPKYAEVRSYGAYAFAIEKGQAPEHRQAAQKPQHGHWITPYYVYSFEFPELPAIKIIAKDGNVAEMFVRRNVPEYKDADPMGVYASKHPPEGRKVIDMGEAPPEPPKPPERVPTPLEQKLRDKLGADK